MVGDTIWIIEHGVHEMVLLGWHDSLDDAMEMADAKSKELGDGPINEEDWEADEEDGQTWWVSVNAHGYRITLVEKGVLLN